MAGGDTLFQESDKLAVNIIAAEPSIAIGGQDAKDALIEFENGNIKRTATQIVNGDPRAVFESVQAIGQRSGGRFIDHSFDREPCQLSGPFCRLALQIVKVSGNSNHSAV